jgi:hypothetical protein
VIRQRWDEACEPLDQLIDGSHLLMSAVRLTVGCCHSQEGNIAVSESSEQVIRDLSGPFHN